MVSETADTHTVYTRHQLAKNFDYILFYVIDMNLFTRKPLSGFRPDKTQIGLQNNGN